MKLHPTHFPSVIPNVQNSMERMIVLSLVPSFGKGRKNLEVQQSHKNHRRQVPVLLSLSQLQKIGRRRIVKTALQKMTIPRNLDLNMKNTPVLGRRDHVKTGQLRVMAQGQALAVLISHVLDPAHASLRVYVQQNLTASGRRPWNRLRHLLASKSKPLGFAST